MNRFSLTFALALFTALTCIAADTTKPDCVGIRLGMSVTEARESLKNHAPRLPVQSVELQLPELAERPVLETLFVVRQLPTPTTKTNSPLSPLPSPASISRYEALETLQVAITLPPNDPVVWKVARSLRFEPGQEPTRTALLEALHKKYGKESLNLDVAGIKISRLWVLGPDGTPLKGQPAQECSTFFNRTYLMPLTQDDMLSRGLQKELLDRFRTSAFQHKHGNTPAIPKDSHQCDSMTYISAELSVGANSELVNQMRVVLIDAALDRKATEATTALFQKAKDTKANQEVEEAKDRKVPAL